MMKKSAVFILLLIINTIYTQEYDPEYDYESLEVQYQNSPYTDTTTYEDLPEAEDNEEYSSYYENNYSYPEILSNNTKNSNSMLNNNLSISTNISTPFSNTINQTNSISNFNESMKQYLDNILNNANDDMSQPLKSKKIPIMVSSQGMLQNIDSSFWILKYYNHPNANLYKYIELYFINSSINIKIIDYNDSIIENKTLYLTPIIMNKPNEGIFAYTDNKGNIFFIYMHLLLPQMLAIDMVNSFEEAQKSINKSLTELGIFILR